MSIRRFTGLLICLIGSGVVSGQNKPATEDRTTDVWTKEPTEFKGVKFFDSEEEARKILTLTDCRLDLLPPDEYIHSLANGGQGEDEHTRVCTLMIPFTSSSSIRATFFFKDDRFVRAQGVFLARDFMSLREAFVELYGPPQRISDSTIRTKAGADYNQQQLYWLGERFVVSLSRYENKVTDGIFMIFQKQEMIDRAKRDLEIKKKALK
jgi:hypothetical protein